MGVGQAADAAPAEGFRCALWSNGTLHIERSTVAGAAELVLLSREETRALVRYLDSICLDVVRDEPSQTEARSGGNRLRASSHHNEGAM